MNFTLQLTGGGKDVTRGGDTDYSDTVLFPLGRWIPVVF